MRLVPTAFVCLAALSLQPAPSPQKAVPASLGWRRWLNGGPGLQLRLAPRLLASPVGRLALGPLRSELALSYSTVTDFARLRGLSMSQPFFSAT
jgi:hypothetical protein